MSRLATLSQGGKTLTYSRLANSDRLDKAEFSPASAAPAVEYSYDTKLHLISKGCGTRYFTDKDEVWYFDCPAGTPGNWGTSRYYSYDSMGQLTLAGEGVMGPDGQVNNPQNFSYDSIGNHLTNNETYSILNQGSGKTYDANGNMTRNGDDWIALYDGENRMRQVVKQYDGTELLYDYAGRIYQVNSFYADEDVQETPTLNYRRIYDGTKLIATVRNGAIEDTFVWQPETSGDADVILWDNSYVYATDPNKNVRVKRFPNDWIPGTWVEEFIDYKPFGELKNYVADPPRFMFSSEEYIPETGMYHYLYRAYSPSLARFITRDPIEEQGGVNLYCFVNNNPVSKWDRWGLIGYNQALRQEWNRQLSEIPWYERIRVRLFEKQWRAALSPEAKFYIWYEADKAEGTAWMDNLPNCPDCIKIGSDGKPENCTNGQWSEIQELEENNFYHPGAKWAMRSNELWGFESGVQQQCTYDKHGYLIKSGMAAGTPDKGTGNVWGYTKHYGKVLFIDHNGGSSEHEDQDVIPFEEALELDGGEEGFYVKKYLELRPPNQGGGSCYD